MVEGFTVTSEDGRILVKWNTPYANNLQSFQLRVLESDQTPILQQEIPSSITSFVFNNGQHGTLYTFELSMVLTGGSKTTPSTARSMFLQYHAMPENIPFIRISTADGTNPSFKRVDPPAGSMGVSITDNFYINATMLFSINNQTNFSKDIRIRVRGNTSAFPDKRAYKIQLSTAANLLDLTSNEYAHTDWFLLPADNLNFLVGSETATLCGIEWQPRYQMVNLMLNGKYMGTYWLTEAVSTASHRCNVQSTGYFIELDAYWWNSDGNYFQTDPNLTSMAFTFKYPDTDHLSENTVTYIRDYLISFQNFLNTGNPTYAQFIDSNSWAAWLLTHDILGTFDCYGSNIFYYKQDYDPANVFNSTLHMGPVWDFDSIYRNANTWSNVHNLQPTYFPQLLKQSDFHSIYTSLWNQLSASLTDSIDDKLHNFIQGNRTGIEESFYLNSVAWRKKPYDLDAEFSYIHNWFSTRTAWLDQHLTK